MSDCVCRDSTVESASVRATGARTVANRSWMFAFAWVLIGRNWELGEEAGNCKECYVHMGTICFIFDFFHINLRILHTTL